MELEVEISQLLSSLRVATEIDPEGMVLEGGRKTQLSPEKENMLVVVGPSGSGKDAILFFLTEVIHKVTTSTSRLRRYKLSEGFDALGVEREVYSSSIDVEKSLIVMERLVAAGKAKRHTLPELKEEPKTKHLIVSAEGEEDVICVAEEGCEDEFLFERNHCVDLEKFDQTLERLTHEGKLASTEDKGDYNRFRRKRVDETQEEYYAHLVEEYSLLEWDRHNKEIYGLPMASILEAQKNLRVIRTEANGAESLIDSVGDRYNLIVITIAPESWEQIREAMQKRESNIPPDQIELRVKEDIEKFERSLQISNYVIKNTRSMVGGKEGLQHSASVFIEILKKIRFI